MMKKKRKFYKSERIIMTANGLEPLVHLYLQVQRWPNVGPAYAISIPVYYALYSRQNLFITFKS